MSNSGCPSPGRPRRRRNRGVGHQPAQEQRVEHALLEPVGDRREPVEVLEHADVKRRVRLSQAPPVRGAEDEVVLRRHVLRRCPPRPRFAIRAAHARRARPGRVSFRRSRDDAVELRRTGVAGLLRRRGIRVRRAVMEAAADCTACGRQVAGHCEGSGHLAQELRVLRRREVLDAGHLERRGVSLHPQIGEVGVAELPEGVVANGEHRRGEAPGAGHGEVPRRVEGLALDPGLVQRLEDRAVARALIAHRLGERVVVAKVCEPRGGLELLSGGVLEIAQRHDVAMPVGQILCRVDEECRVLRVTGV